MIQLPEPIKVTSTSGNKASFEISPLMPGYGATIANPLRRILLSSLVGTAVTSIKIKGAEHEFSSLEGVQEDVIEIILNVKKIRFNSHSEDPVKLTVSAKGVKEVKASDIKVTSDADLITEDQHICTLTDKKSTFEMELEIEKGIGYVPVEQRSKEKLAIGVIAIDAVYSPVRMVNFSVDNIRVGQRIDFNKVMMIIETDGSIKPEAALKQASEILIDHMKIVSDISLSEVKEKSVKKTKKTAKASK